jgi:hypothetical protein
MPCLEKLRGQRLANEARRARNYNLHGSLLLLPKRVYVSRPDTVQRTFLFFPALLKQNAVPSLLLLE